ncbi:MAG: nucleotidyltransferase domain-containing protein [Nanoarchaeota archaeon]|nr:nucleotidyltransferase domain-containing protein [Nanoarchaeota archaeon]MBU1028081.1 nucleotidyltransferase domain-containing protein [Nanoarchaeota archaeon]
MDMYIIKWTRLQAEIFRFLCIKAGHNFNLRSIARPLKKSPTAVSKALQDLEKEGLIKIGKADKIRLLSIGFNRDDEKAIELKRIENLKLIYESGLAKFLEESFPGTTIILFGSYSRGDDVWANSTEENRSDIDIAIIGTKGKDIKLADFNKKLERTIIINFYLSFKKIHKHLRDNILNGIVLSGSVDL